MILGRLARCCRICKRGATTVVILVAGLTDVTRERHSMTVLRKEAMQVAVGTSRNWANVLPKRSLTNMELNKKFG